MGWRPKDILLVTNFNYEYNGIKSIIVDDYEFFDQNRSTKIPAINQLFDDGIIQENDSYWFHDHDAFQLVPFDIKLKDDAAFTDHGAFSKSWNAGSFFFKKNAKDIFEDIWKIMNQKNWNEQNSLTFMWQNNINNINSRYTLLDPSYNIGIYKIDENIIASKLPIKVVHFHPHKKRHFELYKSRNLLPERLLKIFSKYGIK
jgi:hypothetical protein